MAKGIRWGKRFGPGRSAQVPAGRILFNFAQQPASLRTWRMPRPWLHPRPIEEKIRKSQKVSCDSRKKKGIIPSLPKFSFEGQDLTDEQKILNAAAKAIPGGDAQSIFLVQGNSSFVSVCAKGKRFTVIVNNESKRVEDVEGPE